MGQFSMEKPALKGQFSVEINIQKELGLDVHPRTIERVVRAKKASR
jgi:hypothetical protein